jgi:hypothetical protein
LGLRQQKRPLHIQTEAGSFFVGEGAHDFGRPVENLDFDRLTGAPEMKVLLYGTLTRWIQLHGPIQSPVSVMAGLPLQMLSGEEKKTNKESIKGWVGGIYSWNADGHAYQIEIINVDSTPQPVGALFDHLLNEHGQFIPEHKTGKVEVGILPVGFNTIELLVVRGFELVEKFTAGQTAGVRRLLELVNRDGLYSLGELDAALRAGRLDYAAALPIWSREVRGGALLLQDQLSAYFAGKAIFPDDPVLSIARGLYKLAVMKAR